METELFKTLVGMGPTGLMSIGMVFMWRMWKLEREERISVQAANIKLLEDTISSRHELAFALEKIADRVKT